MCPLSVSISWPVLAPIVVLTVGLGFLIAADLFLAFAPGILGVAVGVVLWGLHMGFTQGLFSALVADTAPPELRGTAFGVYNLLTGVILLAASVIAGVFWDAFGPMGTFVAGAAFASIALAGVLASGAISARQRSDRSADR